MRKKHRYIYSYSPATGIEAHQVIERQKTWIAVLPRSQSLCAMSLRTSDLDAGLYYYTTPKRAAAAFVAKAEAAIADQTRVQSHDGWRDALEGARSFLCQTTRARTSRIQKGHLR